MVAHDADAVINEHGRNLMHIVPYLCISLRCIRFFSGRRLQLHQNDRQTVEEQKDIGTLVAVLNERPLIGNDEGVVVRIFVVHKVNEAGAFLTLDKITHFNAMLVNSGISGRPMPSRPMPTPETPEITTWFRPARFAFCVNARRDLRLPCNSSAYSCT